MKVVPLSSEGLRIGRPLPFSVRDKTGGVLLARGAMIQTEKQLQLLQSRPIFIDVAESESVQRAYAGQLVLAQPSPPRFELRMRIADEA